MIVLCLFLPVTCPTSTTPSGKPTVNFEKEQYWSEVIENSPIDTDLVILVASSSSNEEPEYDLIESTPYSYLTKTYLFIQSTPLLL